MRVKSCERCQTPFEAASRAKFCPACRPAAKADRWRRYYRQTLADPAAARKRRLLVAESSRRRYAAQRDSLCAQARQRYARDRHRILAQKRAAYAADRLRRLVVAGNGRARAPARSPTAATRDAHE